MNKRFYITFTIICILLFSLQKGKASISHNVKHKIHANFLKKPAQSPSTKNMYFLINLDDDDETTSKAKYKFFKSLLISNSTQNAIKKAASALIRNVHLTSNSFRCNPQTTVFFSNTSISIAIRCLKI